MTKPVLYPVSMGSNGAKRVQQSLNCLKVYPDRAYKPKKNHVVIVWGQKQAPKWAPIAEAVGTPIINHWSAIAKSANKITAFQEMEKAGVAVVPFTTDKNVALEWQKKKFRVMARTKVSSQGGAGIHVIKPDMQMIDAPLYTVFQARCVEYRYHVAFGKVINIQQKKRKHGQDADDFVRNHENGWVYCREGVEEIPEISEQCIKAVAACGLHFGAVDVMWHPEKRRVGILEINSAPGLDADHSVETYVEAFKKQFPQ